MHFKNSMPGLWIWLQNKVPGKPHEEFSSDPPRGARGTRGNAWLQSQGSPLGRNVRDGRILESSQDSQHAVHSFVPNEVEGEANIRGCPLTSKHKM